ncbi:hypothetical protein KYC5002_20455 [Archangium violaceum]|uniref:hypothetical protein n=1 Tax=Archangium violaceum TaxID=83451 RepID=UPI002B2B7BFF|nr:hypothetical protein KYC5002_20455 [Archangium gephyra]
MKLWKIGWMLAVVGVVVAGCPTRDPDDTCAQDSDCAASQRCEVATGQCVAMTDGGMDGGDTGEVDGGTDGGMNGGVDGGTDGGADGGASCVDASDCLASEFCDPTSKVCVPKCTTDTDCGEGLTCDTATGQCEEKVVDRNLSCTNDSNCLEVEICHPTAKVCVRTCVSGADCPDSAKACDLLSASDTRKVCKCSTDSLCNLDRDTPDLVCSNQDKVCAPRCTEDVDCAVGRICETSTGQCQVWGGTGAPCTGEGQSTCDYGTHFCGTNQCTPLPAPTCANYENFSNKGNLGTTGSVLYNPRLLSVATDTAYCGMTTSTRAKIALSAYRSWPFPASRDGLSGFFMVRPDGMVMDATTLVSARDYSVSGDNRERAEIVVNLCFDPATTSASTGFYFTDGNFLCYQVTF